MEKMAVLQKLFRSAINCERFLPLPTTRCVARIYTPIDSRSTNGIAGHSQSLCGIFLNCTPKPTMLKNPCISLLQRVDTAILPMSPLEQLKYVQLPTISKNTSLEMPTTKASLENAHIKQEVVRIEAPHYGRLVKYHAVRMLVIRRKKMKKHKRKKFLKKFRVLLMTVAKRREIVKETTFFTELEQELKLAESFDAVKYAKEKIRMAYEPLPDKEKLARPFPWEFQPLFHNSKRSKK